MKRPRAVLHLIDTPGQGGAETVFADLIQHLDRDHWRSVAVVPGSGWLQNRLVHDGSDCHLFSPKGPFDYRYAWKLFQLARRTGVALIHAHLFTSAVYGSVVAHVCRVPLVCTLHGQVDVSTTERYRGIKLRILKRGGTRFVFVSEPLREYYTEQYSLSIARTAVIPNGINPDVYGRAKACDVRSEFRFDRSAFLVGAVGNVRPPKDYETFLRAAAELRRESDRYRFLVVGDTNSPRFGGLLELKDELGLGERIVFTGFRDDVPQLLKALDVLVISSSAEGFSLAAVQAMASGLPVVATRCGGPETIIDNERTGLLVDPQDPHSIALAVRRLVDDPELRGRLARAGAAEVKARFSLDSMIKSYERLYASLLA